MKSGFLADIESGRDNNLNLVRMLAATGVLISHAWPVSTGDINRQPLGGVLNGIDLGMISVFIFFAISGYLIAQSFDRDPDLVHFWFSRVMRIFPALLVVLVMTALVLAPLVTVADTNAVWRAAPQYIVRNFTLFSLQQYLPGVFRGNPVGGSVNIPLWTLSHELTCYFSVMIIGMAGVLKSPRLMLIAALVFVLLYGFILYFEPQQRLVALMKLALPFMIGVAFFVWRQRLPLNWTIGGGLILLASVLHGTFIFREAFILALAYVIFLVAFLPGGRIRAYNKLGDYSYGIYIYAFPIQQLVAYTGVTNPLLNILLAFPVTLAFAVLSWAFVEKPALGLAKRLKRRKAAEF